MRPRRMCGLPESSLGLGIPTRSPLDLSSSRSGSDGPPRRVSQLEVTLLPPLVLPC